MEEKYYIPDISEFHIGFEYEILQKAGIVDDKCFTFMPVSVEDEWFKFKYPDPYLGYRLDLLFKKEIRVKYLDSEDIISLGFNFSHDVYVKNCGDRLLSLVIKDDKIRICEMSNSDKYKVLFYGKIKNKSELKDILEKI